MSSKNDSEFEDKVFEEDDGFFNDFDFESTNADEFGEGGFPVDGSLNASKNAGSGQVNNAYGVNSGSTGSVGKKGTVNGTTNQVNTDGLTEANSGNSVGSKSSLSHKKVGIIVFVFLIVVALVITIIRGIDISRSPQVESGNVQSSSNSVERNSSNDSRSSSNDTTNNATGTSNTSNGITNSNSIATNNSSISSNTSDTQSNTTGSESNTEANTSNNSSDKRNTTQTKTQSSNNTDEVVSSNSDSSIASMSEVDNSSINYDVPLYKTQGVVSSKRVFMSSNGQLIYVLELSIQSNNIGDSSYYCGYDAFSSINENDSVTVMYKKVSDTLYAITKVSK